MNSHPLKRCERLRGSARFRIIKGEARQIKGEWLLINICPQVLPFNRIGVSISAKKIFKSTRRNRLRRLIREVYRLHKGEFKKGFDIVVRPKAVKEDLNFKEVEKDLLNIFKKAGILI